LIKIILGMGFPPVADPRRTIYGRRNRQEARNFSPGRTWAAIRGFRVAAGSSRTTKTGQRAFATPLAGTPSFGSGTAPIDPDLARHADPSPPNS
jgi:hypothetical protein